MEFTNYVKKKNLKKEKGFSWTPDVIFILLMSLGLLLTFSKLLSSHGALFSEMFFKDYLDTGMDFFHSIEYTKGRSPYALYRTLYPPLANLFFYILFCMVPSWQYDNWADTFTDSVHQRGTSDDLRVVQPTMLLFITFIILFTVLFVLLIKKVIVLNKNSGIIAFLMLFSWGVLYAMERGNVIVLALLCSMFFAFYKDSENKIISELALLSLAVATGLKLYPAIFGMVLLYDKQYKKAVRTIVYGILLFIVPFFFFQEGMGGCRIFFDVLFHKTEGSGLLSSTDVQVVQKLLITGGITLNTILNMIVTVISRILGITLNVSFWESFLYKCSIVMILFLVLSGFFMKKKWQQYLVCSLVFIFYSMPGIYIMSFLLIPLLSFIKEERELNESVLIPFVALVITQMVLPISKNTFIGELSVYYLRFQICLLILLLYLFYEAGKRIHFIINRKRCMI